MMRKSDFDTPVEQRYLLNQERGPPNAASNNPVFDLYGSPKQTTNGSAYGRYTDRPRSAMTTGFAATSFPFLGSADGLIDEKELMKGLKEKDQQILSLHNKLKSAHDEQHTIKEELLKTYLEKKELEEHIKKLQELKERENLEQRSGNRNQDKEVSLVSSLPDVSARSDVTAGNSDDFIDLMPCEEPAHKVKEQFPDDEAALVKSIQCSEASIEEPVDLIKDEKKIVRHDDPGAQKKGIYPPSPSSSSSFEVVGECTHRNCATHLELLRQDMEKQKVQMNEIKDQLEEFKSTKELKIAEIENALENIVQQKWQGIAAVGVTSSEDHQEKLHKELAMLKWELAEVKNTIWKSTENKQELMRENERLMRMEQEKQFLWSASGSDKNQIDRERERRHAVESVLETKAQQLSEMEARVRELEHTLATQQFRLGNSELGTENTLLKHQIEAYKEDFEVERKDREMLVSQKNTLQQCIDTLRTELNVARTQGRQFEDEVHKLRNDNDTLKRRLREATEELDRLKDPRQPMMAGRNDIRSPWIQNHPFSNPASQNVFVSGMPTSACAVQSDWECKRCTYKNPSPRTFCEMCGCSEPPRSSATSQVPASSYVPNIPVTSGIGHQSPWNLTSPTQRPSELLPNLRNYGDIETD